MHVHTSYILIAPPPFTHTRARARKMLAFPIIWLRSTESLWKSPPEMWVRSVGRKRPLPVKRGCSPQHLPRLASHSALRLCHQLHVRARPGRSVLPRGRWQGPGLSVIGSLGLIENNLRRVPRRGAETFMPKCGWLLQVPHSAGISSRVGERTSGGGRNHPASYYPQANTQSEVAPEWQLPGLMQADVYVWLYIMFTFKVI